MPNNIIDSILNVLQVENFNLRETLIRTNRANSMGDALEKFTLDLFSGNLMIEDEDEKLRNIDRVFSYVGNDSNPPDAMIRNGDAIEIKKIETRGTRLQLNSSSPHRYLLSTDDKLTQRARDAEEWTQKDMIYVVGVIKDNRLIELAIIDSNTYVASTCYGELFTNVKNALTEAIENTNIEDIEWAETAELGRVNNVDANRITSLRIRPMWLLDNPFKVFSDVYSQQEDATFNLISIISLEKWETLDNQHELLTAVQANENLELTEIELTDPENEEPIRAKKITYFFNAE